ncbi:SdpI family protein [Terribacillus sp. 179-K 1B1 HS]|uniref:SdpI family protein n=1 Tax=Terribacillus sp. 179-K 1B1 HS TaxID=3142388 RepID=UPI0039A257BD
MLILICGIGHLMGGLMLKLSDPGSTNRMAGYRTKRSMKNEALWKFGQSYAAKLLVLMGVVNIIVGGMVLLFFHYDNELFIFVELVWVIASLVLVYSLTEWKLKRLEETMTSRRDG